MVVAVVMVMVMVLVAVAVVLVVVWRWQWYMVVAVVLVAAMTMATAMEVVVSKKHPYINNEFCNKDQYSKRDFSQKYLSSVAHLLREHTGVHPVEGGDSAALQPLAEGRFSVPVGVVGAVLRDDEARDVNVVAFEKLDG